MFASSYSKLTVKTFKKRFYIKFIVKKIQYFAEACRVSPVSFLVRGQNGKVFFLKNLLEDTVKLKGEGPNSPPRAGRLLGLHHGALYLKVDT